MIIDANRTLARFAGPTQYVDWSKAEVVRFQNLRNALSEHLEPPPILSDES